MCDTQKEWCEVGEHYVDPDEMWPCFADCKNCVSEKEYKEAMGEEEEEVHCCIDCDYTLTENEFDAGKGRIMFSEGEGIEDGEYRCGVCDIRASHDGYEDLRRCATCDEELDEDYWKAFAFENGEEPQPVYCSSKCEP